LHTHINTKLTHMHMLAHTHTHTNTNAHTHKRTNAQEGYRYPGWCAGSCCS